MCNVQHFPICYKIDVTAPFTDVANTFVCVRPKRIQGHTWQRDLEPHLRVLFLLHPAPNMVLFRLPGHSRRAEACNASNVVWRTNNVFDSRGLPLDLVGHTEEENGGGDQGDEENCNQRQFSSQFQFLFNFWSFHQRFLLLALFNSAASRKSSCICNHPWISQSSSEWRAGWNSVFHLPYLWSTDS